MIYFHNYLDIHEIVDLDDIGEMIDIAYMVNIVNMIGYYYVFVDIIDFDDIFRLVVYFEI
jgi:hypothetical protein